MIMDWLSQLGPWNWMVLGAVLLTLEIVAPGAYLLWLGIAAVLTGTLSLQLWESAAWVWQVQVLVFLALSIASVLIGKRFFPNSSPDDTDQPLLNQRERQLIGRTATLQEPITEGYGRIRLGDTLWRVNGPDLPAGARVRVVAAEDGHLRVEAL
ncbi:NfeD family protein [Mesorhizobium microcysteis]|jgi:membrane protein implicated in regulation of membrane protease activity|uniref:NfeD family protein n=1 Tax=Neoaquamicrobium microcysteis TaxID=2682781 RepID=A0A5D4GPT8_9HYPH|nr:NfeD family protein [Mesorhizobium microcysteis]TYR30184.1 NfeD family protein [Mesorhizobium microcysteis]